MSLSRKGSSLIELLVALALVGVIAAVVARLLLSATMQLRDRSERITGEQALRVAANEFRAVVEGLGQDAATGADLGVMGPASLSARVTRAAGVVCAASPGLLVVHAGPDWWTALRDPVAGRDSVLAAHPADTGWRAFAIAAPPGSASCPDGGPGISLPVAGDSLGQAGIGAGSPLRLVEQVELRLYVSAPDQWLGMRLLATAQAIQPFAGPLAASGLGITYRRRDASPALLPAEVAAAAVRVAALTERAGGVGLVRGLAPRSDSVTVFIALLNPP
ncbi:MAG TPA: type II secretion system protein [Gemmatimonadales bacterium]|nr:type II secretion system protein [Gemmatimonadales bacterium]